MASFFQTLSDVFSAFGAAVFVPVILFIIAKCMGVTGKKAFNTALLCAVGLTGFRRHPKFCVNLCEGVK